MTQVVARTGTVVSPKRLKWHGRLLATIIYTLIELVGRTLRLRWDQNAPLERIAPERRAIFCVWHNRLAISMIVYRDYICKTGRIPKLAAIVSASKDGGIVARILEHFGVEPVRGSSSRRGPQALLELTSCSERGYDVAITPDGPRGPRYTIQPGVISLAQLTGLPIVPISYHYRWKLSVRSWDGFQIPLPFSQGQIRMGEPMEVPRNASDEQREAIRAELERRLTAMTVD
jgi:lysophospholipid acyltransferase (LPLAT)-like uncharacterized protein